MTDVALFIHGPLHGSVAPFGRSRIVCAEWPQSLAAAWWEDPEPGFPCREPVMYRVGRFARGREQWIWVGWIIAAGHPAPGEVWAALARPGVRRALQCGVPLYAAPHG